MFHDCLIFCYHEWKNERLHVHLGVYEAQNCPETSIEIFLRSSHGARNKRSSLVCFADDPVSLANNINNSSLSFVGRGSNILSNRSGRDPK